jgi:hypothetical protein
MKTALLLAALSGVGAAGIQALIRDAAPTTVESCHAAHVVVHTYDGPAATEFCFDDFQYTGADVFLIGHEDGDGIFHDGFEVAR